jgi:DNA-directed RNA polymerase sigma subunit (sigma70/sigma32)
MVALIKPKTITPRESQRSAWTGRLRKARPAPELGQARPPLRADREAEEIFAKDNVEPKPEELTKENEILGAQAEAKLTAAAEVEAEVGVLEPESRQHSSYDGSTVFKLYLREIGQVKLLTPQEEIKLAARIKIGDKKAREQMIKANLRLVVKIARDYQGIGLPLLDLISEGNIGLMKAVERFNPAKGCKLSTYGAWRIKQAIKRALANQRKTIRQLQNLALANLRKMIEKVEARKT